jgi:PBP1b-binding outer membrane lipoprotein LpoB
MQRTLSSSILLSLLFLGGCGAGETAAVASLQAEQAKQAQQQIQQLQQQVDQANAQNNLRLQQATEADR